MSDSRKDLEVEGIRRRALLEAAKLCLKVRGELSYMDDPWLGATLCAERINELAKTSASPPNGDPQEEKR